MGFLILAMAVIFVAVMFNLGSKEMKAKERDRVLSLILEKNRKMEEEKRKQDELLKFQEEQRKKNELAKVKAEARALLEKSKREDRAREEVKGGHGNQTLKAMSYTPRPSTPPAQPRPVSKPTTSSTRSTSRSSYSDDVSYVSNSYTYDTPSYSSNDGGGSDGGGGGCD